MAQLQPQWAQPKPPKELHVEPILAREPPVKPRAVRLHVAHSWGGGLSKWVREFAKADQELGLGTDLVLRSIGVPGAYGQRLSLYLGDEEVTPLRFWELGVPVHATAIRHAQIQSILAEIVRDFGVEQVLVSSLIGHSLDTLRTGLPTLVVAHDHYPYCVALYAHYDGECRSCDTQRLSRCMVSNPEHRFFLNVTAEDWSSLRTAFVRLTTELKLPIAAPSPSVAARWLSMMPELAPSQFHVVQHGLNLAPVDQWEAPQEGPLRIVVLGRLTREKGANLLAAMLPDLLTFSELNLIGCGEGLDGHWKQAGIRMVPHYRNDALPGLLRDQAPHVALLISTVPETFSYTLSELWHARIPVVATASGALADRITHGQDGFLVEPEVPALLNLLSELNTNREVLRAMKERLSGLATRSVHAMVSDYDRLLVRSFYFDSKTTAGEEISPALVTALQTQKGSHAPHARLLQVNPEATWLQAVEGFWQYTCGKAARSPRLPAWIQRWFAQRLAG
jgi:glycosyltransferase involved in cell wall biosynthesis